MKISCLQENLAKGLATVGRAVASRSTLPVLANILLQSDGGRLRLAATNFEIGINCWIGARVEEEGSITVPARLLTEFVNSLPAGQIDETVPVPEGSRREDPKGEAGEPERREVVPCERVLEGRGAAGCQLTVVRGVARDLGARRYEVLERGEQVVAGGVVDGQARGQCAAAEDDAVIRSRPEAPREGQAARRPRQEEKQEAVDREERGENERRGHRGAGFGHDRQCEGAHAHQGKQLAALGHR